MTVVLLNSLEFGWYIYPTLQRTIYGPESMSGWTKIQEMYACMSTPTLFCSIVHMHWAGMQEKSIGVWTGPGKKYVNY